MNNSYITIIKEKRTVLSRKRVPLNQNECTANFRIGVPFEQNLQAYPWDNACIESFHALLKREWINRFKIFNYAHAHKLIFEYIETFYNTVRIHSHCGYLSPNEYEEQYLENIEENAIKIAS